jgi:hypothetical protein
LLPAQTDINYPTVRITCDVPVNHPPRSQQINMAATSGVTMPPLPVSHVANKFDARRSL